MALADFLNGGAQSIQQLLLQRQLEKMGVSPAQLAQRKLAGEDEDRQIRRDTLAFNQKRQAALDAETAREHQSANDLKLGDLVPPGGLMTPTDPLAQSMQRIGLAQENRTLPSTQMT